MVFKISFKFKLFYKYIIIYMKSNSICNFLISKAQGCIKHKKTPLLLFTINASLLYVNNTASNSIISSNIYRYTQQYQLL